MYTDEDRQAWREVVRYAIAYAEAGCPAHRLMFDSEFCDIAETLPDVTATATAIAPLYEVTP